MKIKNITINKYKSFKKEETIPVDSKNLFIYGENGAGKSSFYYALKDFFQSSVEDIKMSDLRNMFLTDDGTDCSIEVEFDGGTKSTLNELTKDTNIPAITDANRLKVVVSIIVCLFHLKDYFRTCIILLLIHLISCQI